MCIHPDGRFMYITGRNCILVSQYNKVTNEFQKPTTFAGREGEAGYSPSLHLSARFQEPYQGTFVKNEEYIKILVRTETFMIIIYATEETIASLKLLPTVTYLFLQEEAVSLLTTRYLAILTEN